MQLLLYHLRPHQISCTPLQGESRSFSPPPGVPFYLPFRSVPFHRWMHVDWMHGLACGTRSLGRPVKTDGECMHASQAIVFVRLQAPSLDRIDRSPFLCLFLTNFLPEMNTGALRSIASHCAHAVGTGDRERDGMCMRELLSWSLSGEFSLGGQILLVAGCCCC